MWMSLFSRLRKLGWIVGWIHNTEDCCSDLWSHQLQQDIIDNILERLGALDRIRFGAVCACWRAAVGRSTSTSALDFPFVLQDAVPFSYSVQWFSCLDDDKNYFLNPKITKDRTRILVGVIEGRWLIMRRRVTHLILNPVTGKKFLLPPIATKFIKMEASSEPTIPTCLVAGLGRETPRSLAFCRLTNSKWTFLHLEDEDKDLEIGDIVFCDGKLYLSTVHNEDFIIAFDLRQENKNEVYKAHKIVMATPSPISTRSSTVVWQDGLLYGYYAPFSMFAADLLCRELLLIICDAKLVSTKHPNSHHLKNLVKAKVISMRVYKMVMTDDKNQWIQVTDLGDRILFWSMCGSFFMPTKPSFGGLAHQGNCIYYICRLNIDWCDVGKFCLNDQTVTRYPNKRRNANGWVRVVDV